MPNLSKIIQKPISGEWGIEGERISVIRTTNFTNEGIIDLSNVATDGLIQPIPPVNETVLIIPPEK